MDTATNGTSRRMAPRGLPHEKEYLLTLVRDYADIINDKSHWKSNYKRKQECWDEVTEKFNNVTTQYRTSQEVKKLYGSLRKTGKVIGTRCEKQKVLMGSAIPVPYYSYELVPLIERYKAGTHTTTATATASSSHTSPPPPPPPEELSGDNTSQDSDADIDVPDTSSQDATANRSKKTKLKANNTSQDSDGDDDVPDADVDVRDASSQTTTEIRSKKAMLKANNTSQDSDGDVDVPDADVDVPDGDVDVPDAYVDVSYASSQTTTEIRSKKAMLKANNTSQDSDAEVDVHDPDYEATAENPRKKLVPDPSSQATTVNLGKKRKLWASYRYTFQDSDAEVDVHDPDYEATAENPRKKLVLDPDYEPATENPRKIKLRSKNTSRASYADVDGPDSSSQDATENPRKMKLQANSKKTKKTREEAYELSMKLARERHEQSLKQERILHETQLRYLSEHHELQQKLGRIQMTVLRLQKKYWLRKLQE